MKKITILFSLSIAICFGNIAKAQSFTENFDSIPTLFTGGWDSINESAPLGIGSWFQGNTTVFMPYSSTGYIASNYTCTDSVGTGNIISNWLAAPLRWMHNGDMVMFYTRTVDSSTNVYPDRLQFRLSTAGPNSQFPTDASNVGTYTTKILDIDSAYSHNSHLGGYPFVWKKYTVTLSGLPAGGTGCRFAFRYYVENGGFSGTNSNYIGIDSVAYITTFSGIENHYNLTDFYFYPNPSNGNIKVSIKAQGNQERKLNVIDMLGNVVFEKIYANTFFDIDLSGLTSGMYFINVIDDKGVSSKKLIIQ